MLEKKGENWRLISDPTKGKFSILIGVDKWSIVLQESEFVSLYNLLSQLEHQLKEIKDDLMPNELINLEIEKIPWYAELDGRSNEWSLRIIFDSIDGTRSFEMYWPIQTAQTLFFEIKKMWESRQ